MPARILLIDDDPRLLSALTRQLEDNFELTSAEAGGKAIELAKAAQAGRAPFAVALCDMRMPGMDGIETLARLRDVSPDTVRMMLTGNADQDTAIRAINCGNIFRFFTKPCAASELKAGLDAGVEQYRLVTAERELLGKTLAGSLKMLIDLMSMNDPVAYQSSMRIREWVHLIAIETSMPHPWQLEVAATLVGIAQLTIPPELATKLRQREALTEVERVIVERAPEAARNLMANIPRMELVAEILLYQDRGYDGSGFPPDGPSGEAIPLGSRLLRILKDLAAATEGGPLTRATFQILQKRVGLYDPNLLARVRAGLENTISDSMPTVMEIPLSALRVGQMILSDIRTSTGHLVLAAGSITSAPHLERLRGLRKRFTFIEPIKVRV